MPNTEVKWLHVVVGVILCPDTQRILLAKRQAGKHEAGKWEFPGGKVEQGETVQQALARELQEELGIVVNPETLSAVGEVRHHYAERSIWLDVWQTDQFSGEPQGLEGQAIAWFDLDALEQVNFPEANRSIVEILRRNHQQHQQAKP